MAFIIPNAVDTSSGAKFENLDQAEPDSLDFEILGNIGRSGVLSGCEVTSISSSTAVAVSAGTVIVNGSSYSVAANTALALPVAPLGTRFDLVIARVASGTASLRVITGDDDDVNPEYPKSASVIAGSFNSATNIDFNTDVVLAAVYRQGVQSVTTSRIADKRVILSSAIFNKGSDAPVDTASVSEVSDAGSLFFRTTSPSGTSSGVYVKGLYGNWMELARNIGPHFPIGAIAAWPATGALPSGFIEADGQSLLVTDYPALFGVYGYTHGGSGNSFNVPDLNGRSLKGTTNQGLVGDTVGSDSVTLTVDNLPEHNHGIGSHTHTLSHTHSIDHSHSGSATSAGGHSHGYGDEKVSSGSGPEIATGAGRFRYTSFKNTDPAGSHSHTVTVGSPSPTFTSSQSEATTSTPNTGVTDDTGSSQSFSNIPASAYVRWIIRAAHGVEADTVGGTSLLDEALEETVTLELVGSGSLPASQTGAASFRMPYGALLTEVRAGLNSGSNATSAISIDINEAGTSVLSTPLTIDAGESSSTTAATAAVISDPDIADDALITIDIDSADTGDTGPLTVTLYFTRDA
jgi:microcystin-dependent protein